MPGSVAKSYSFIHSFNSELQHIFMSPFYAQSVNANASVAASSVAATATAASFYYYFSGLASCFFILYCCCWGFFFLLAFSFPICTFFTSVRLAF